MKVSNYISEIEQLIANGDTESACEGLLHLVGGDQEDFRSQILLLTGQFRELQRNKTLGMGNDKESMNRLNYSLLQLCKDLKTDLGNQQISDIDLSELEKIKQSNQVQTPPSVAKSAPINWGLWLKIGGFLIVSMILYRAYSCVSKTFKSVKDELATVETPQQTTKSSTNSSPTTTTNTSSTATPIADIKPTYLDVKAKLQGFELLETRLYPADGTNRIVFMGKWYCDRYNNCNFGSTQFELVADGQVISTETKNFQTVRHDDYGSLLVTGYSHEFVEIAYDFPPNTQNLALKIKIDGNATIPVDLKKQASPPPVLPITFNLTEEKDLNITKVFSKDFQLQSVRVIPFDDNYFKLYAKIAKCDDHCDFYNLCIRILMDNGTTQLAFESLKTKEFDSPKGQAIREYEFIVPRTVQAPELVVGNCGAGKTPFKVALPL
jgi:Effector-associated domain 11